MNSIRVGLNIIKRLLNDFTILVFLIALPIVAGVVTVLMFGEDEIISVGLANLPDEHQEIVRYIENAGQFDIQMMSEAQVERSIEEKEIGIGVVLPADFEAQLADKSVHNIALISLQADEEVYALKVLLEGYVNAYYTGEESVLEADAAQEADAMKPRAAIGMLTVFIVVFAGMGMSLILEDKKKKTFMRIFCAPLNGYEIVLGNLMANILLGAVQIIIFLFTATMILKFDWATPVWQVFILLFFFMVAAVGIGIGLAGFIQDEQKYPMILSMVGVITGFLGGSFIPTDMLNTFLQKVAYFMPQKWLMEGYDKLAAGGGMVDIQMQLLILILFGAVFFTFGVNTLRPAETDL